MWTEEGLAHLEDHGEVFSAHVVVGLDEDLAQSTLADRVVLGVELVEPVKRVAVLRAQSSRDAIKLIEHIWLNNAAINPGN